MLTSAAQNCAKLSSASSLCVPSICFGLGSWRPALTEIIEPLGLPMASHVKRAIGSAAAADLSQIQVIAFACLLLVLLKTLQDLCLTSCAADPTGSCSIGLPKVAGPGGAACQVGAGCL